MIFQTEHQLNCVFIFVFSGIIVGLLSLLFLLNYRKKPIKILIFTIFYSFFCIFFEFLLIFFNFGKISLTLFTSYIFGFLWIRILTRKTVVIFYKKCYNTFNKILKRNNKGKTNVKSKKS